MNAADISEAMKTIGSLGGKARKDSLSAKRRSEIARQGGKARWKKSKKAKPR
jgi:hypothetical protein